MDDTFGEVPGSPIASILPGENVILTLLVLLSEETTNLVTVAGGVGNVPCEDTAIWTITKNTPLPSPDTITPSPKVKKGKSKNPRSKNR